jgi:hypothetical protein
MISLQQQRTVYFPSGSSIGHVSAADNRNLGSKDECPSIDLGAARGRIVVPAGWDLELYLDAEGRADLSGLSGLKPNDLQNLVVHPRCVVMDSDLRYVRQLTGLLRLSLNCQFDISDAGIDYISHLSSLRYLDITMASGLTDEGLKKLRGMRQLEYLILLGTSLDSKSVGPLGMLRSLKYLNLENTFITEQEVTRLLVLLEGCSIVHKHRPTRIEEKRIERVNYSKEDSNRKSLSQRVRELGGIGPSDR